ncbi:HIT family hydrolase, diadenosine tetraphosphate hydrolase [Frankia canadensis]|uniref:HIT family hydrolase, diadenosine tetraphosphate hydrolase n=1 Tax=Frankia canadensis TaxID=1836972 RepID=A0A2I2KTJ5_9ACTN|nr:HIT domain-containing protein [Frankia canadensis]SNQ48969.1 HIT family hydrolase, diadenosine tetraphosphate hydrolase [Frankia canadensis]SOU56259.1 HIT family hydrolase, diadenosine tetraphosphate hydrolase [Frankia canadensis]
MSEDDGLAALRRGEDPNILARLRTGWAVLGATQLLPGYCLLIHDGDADQLTDLPRAERTAFLADLALLGEAIAAVCAAADPGFLRINYEVLGNAWHHLHGHVRARYTWEDERLRVGPVDLYGPALTDPRHAAGPAHDPLRAQLSAALTTITRDAYAEL